MWGLPIFLYGHRLLENITKFPLFLNNVHNVNWKLKTTFPCQTQKKFLFMLPFSNFLCRIFDIKAELKLIKLSNIQAILN